MPDAAHLPLLKVLLWDRPLLLDLHREVFILILLKYTVVFSM